DASFGQNRQKDTQFAKAHQRIAAYERKVQWAVLLYNAQDATDQLCPLLVVKLAQVQPFAHVAFFIGITTRAPQRTLPRDFDGDRRLLSAQGLAPSPYYMLPIHGHSCLGGLPIS